MRRWMPIAALSLILIALPVWAQRGGRGSAGGAHISSGGGHSSASFHSGGFSGHGSGGIRVRGRSSNYNRGFYGRRGYYPYYAYYPYGYYGWYDDSLAYDAQPDQDVYASAPYPAPYPENSGLQQDVQALNGKIDRLQADVEARNRKPEVEPATALVFRDQHVEEVHNYAIAGGTLWVLNEKAAKKIPLAQLDLDATVKLNDDRGIDFQLPR
jgi:hypothetical protein